MSKLSYTAKIRLSITMEEIYRYSKPLVNNNELKEAIKDELMQCAEGIVGGDFGGNYRDDWKLVFFRQLEKQGVIELNEYGKDTF